MTGNGGQPGGEIAGGGHILAAYQIGYLLDPARLKLLVKSRRIGGSFMATLEASWGAAGFDCRSGGLDLSQGEDEFLVSASQGQSEEMLNECVRHLELLERLHAVPGSLRRVADGAGVKVSVGVLTAMHSAAVAKGAILSPRALLREQRSSRAADRKRTKLIRKASTKEIVLVNGRVIRAMAANPRTVRGFTGNVTIDEFGAMPYSRKIWEALKPVADKNLGSEKGFKLRILGTPLGDDNQFYQLARTEAGRRFSRHEISIYQAVACGFPIDPAAAREEMGDEESFLQEFCCEFLSATSRYVPDDLLDRAAYDATAPEFLHEMDRARQAVRYGGMDVARAPTGDYSALALVFRVGDTYWLLPDLWADRGVSFSAQKERVRDEIQSGCRRVSIDSHGIGHNMAEDLQKEFGAERVELVPMVAPTKEDLATRLKRLLTEGRLRIPAGEHQLRREILALKRSITKTGHTRFDVERTQKGGHGDRAWALMLALHAAENSPAAYAPKLRRGR